MICETYVYVLTVWKSEEVIVIGLPGNKTSEGENMTSHQLNKVSV